jgi:hypothetical protein
MHSGISRQYDSDTEFGRQSHPQKVRHRILFRVVLEPQKKFEIGTCPRDHRLHYTSLRVMQERLAA